MSIEEDTIDRARNGDVEYFREAPLRVIQTAMRKEEGCYSSFSIALLANKLECCKMIYSRCPSLLYHCDRTHRHSAMHHAAARGWIHFIEFLIWANDRKDYVGEETDVESGLRREEIKNLNLLTMPDSWGWVPLHHAVGKTTSVKTVKMLIEADHGRDTLKMVNNKNKTPLHLALEEGNIEIVRALIEADNGRDSLKMVNDAKETPWHMAVRKGNIEMATALIEANPDFQYGVNSDGDTPLSLAMKAKSVTMQVQKEFPEDMQCKDKFLLQSAITISGDTDLYVIPKEDEELEKQYSEISQHCVADYLSKLEGTTEDTLFLIGPWDAGMAELLRKDKQGTRHQRKRRFKNQAT